MNSRERFIRTKYANIIAPAHNIQDDTSIENILAFLQAAKI